MTKKYEPSPQMAIRIAAALITLTDPENTLSVGEIAATAGCGESDLIARMQNYGADLIKNANTQELCAICQHMDPAEAAAFLMRSGVQEILNRPDWRDALYRANSQYEPPTRWEIIAGLNARKHQDVTDDWVGDPLPHRSALGRPVAEGE